MAEIVITASNEEAGRLAANIIASRAQQKPDLVLGLATGSSPQPVYEALARLTNQGLDLSRMRAFALEEYVGLPEGHAQSYRAVIDREVTSVLGLDSAKVAVPSGAIGEIDSAGNRYEEEILSAGGVDVQLVGLGGNGHIGFNEPGSSLASLTRLKTLTDQTRKDNSRYFATPEEVPRYCITQGIGTILRARHVVLLAFGKNKAVAVKAALEGPVSASVPGTALQLHPRVTVFLDEAAASSLTNIDYYRHTYENKPHWQQF